MSASTIAAYRSPVRRLACGGADGVDGVDGVGGVGGVGGVDGAADAASAPERRRASCSLKLVTARLLPIAHRVSRTVDPHCARSVDQRRVGERQFGAFACRVIGIKRMKIKLIGRH